MLLNLFGSRVVGSGWWDVLDPGFIGPRAGASGRVGCETRASVSGVTTKTEGAFVLVPAVLSVAECPC